MPNGGAVYVILAQGLSAQNIVKAFQPNLFGPPSYHGPPHTDVDVGKVINGLGMQEFVWCVSLQGGVLCFGGRKGGDGKK